MLSLSHSENRKPTPFSSEDHPMCLPPSTSCKNVFMKPPLSQSQRVLCAGGGGILGQEACRLLAHRKPAAKSGQSKEESVQEVCLEIRHFLSSLCSLGHKLLHLSNSKTEHRTWSLKLNKNCKSPPTD